VFDTVDTEFRLLPRRAASRAASMPCTGPVGGDRARVVDRAVQPTALGTARRPIAWASASILDIGGHEHRLTSARAQHGGRPDFGRCLALRAPTTTPAPSATTLRVTASPSRKFPPVTGITLPANRSVIRTCYQPSRDVLPAPEGARGSQRAFVPMRCRMESLPLAC